MGFKKLKKPGRPLILLLLIVTILLSATGVTEKGLQFAGLKRMAQSNDRYLDHAFIRALTTFGVLSAVKVGLAILEGTEVGVGFGLQIGDAVQSAYDYINLAWKTVLTSAAVLLGTRYLLQTAKLLDQGFLIATLIAIFLMLLVKWYLPRFIQLRRILRDIGLFLTILTISLFILLPLSVAGGKLLSERITGPSMLEAEESLVIMKEELFPDDKDQDKGLWSKVSGATERIKKITEYLSLKATALSIWMLKLIAGYLFDTIIFPLSLFIFLLWFTRLTAQYLFELKRTQTLKEDIELILSRYLLKKSQ